MHMDHQLMHMDRDGEPRLEMTENDARKWGMIVHLTLIGSYMLPVVGTLVPLATWLAKKGRHERLDRHGAMVVDAALCYHGVLLVTFALSFYLLGMFPFVAVLAALVTLPAIGAVKANEGDFWTYPGVWPIVRRRMVPATVHDPVESRRAA